MKNPLPWWLLATVFSVLMAGSAQASPQTPVELRISDTPDWTGALVSPETGTGPVGVSAHPYFRVRHLSTGASAPATKLRVQVGADPEFIEIHWDSGFVNIEATAHLELTPGVPYSGPALETGGYYYWRAAVKDSSGAASGFSEPANFQMAEMGAGVDLRASTGAGPEVSQGNPVPVSVWPPSLTAEFSGGEGDLPAIYASLEAALDSGFEEIVWSVESIPTGEVLPGQRSVPIFYDGDIYDDHPLFWRIKFITADGLDWPWSTATSSFIFSPPDPTVGSPGGFARASASFGIDQAEVASVALGDVNTNGAMDAVVVSRALDGTHVLYPDVGTTSPGGPIPFGATEGGAAFAFVSDFNLDGQTDVAVVNQVGVRTYTHDGTGVLGLSSELQLDIGEPVAAQQFDVNWDGWTDLVVLCEQFYLIVYGGKEGFIEYQQTEILDGPATDLLVTDFNTRDRLHEVWILSAGLLQLYRGYGWLEQSWQLEGATRLALADQSNPNLSAIIAAGEEQLYHCTVSVPNRTEVTLSVDLTQEHTLAGGCQEIVGTDLTGDGVLDIVLTVGNCVSVWRGLEYGYELHEYVGHPGQIPVVSTLVADMNGDTFPDVVSGHAEAGSGIYFNKPRIGAAVEGFEAHQQEFGEAYVAFKITLDSAPKSLVEVWCETYEEEPEGGGGEGIGGNDDDKFPDLSDVLEAQAGPLHYIHTSKRIAFVPGQTVAWFYVPLTRYFYASQWQLHVRLFSPVGMYVVQSTTSATVHGIPQSIGPQSAPPAGPGMQRDWKVNGEVHDVVQAGQNTYFGGDFSGITWSATGSAALDSAGKPRLALPELSSGTVRTVGVAPDGSMYIGGSFTISTNSGQIQNIAKFSQSGALVESFAPNPNGPVNAIAFDGWQRVYFGGQFSSLANGGSMPFYNLAFVTPNGAVVTSGPYGVSTPSNYYGAYNSSIATESVQVIKIAHSGNATLGEYVLVGGTGLDTARRGNLPTPIGNFVGFGSKGGILAAPKFYQGGVHAIEVATSGALIGQGDLSYPIFVGGSFDYAKWGSVLGSPSSPAHFAVTNFSGHYNSALLSHGSPTQVTALKFDSAGRLWKARHSVGTVDPIVVYTVSGGLLAPAATISGNATVLSLAAGTDEIVATGYFSSIGGVNCDGIARISANGGGFGTVQPMATRLRTGTVLSVAFDPNGNTGYLLGGALWGLEIPRGNLAAMDAQGHLLDWAPDANGPVYAMETDGNWICFGGAFSSVSGQNRKGLAAALANNNAQSPVNWIIDVSGVGTSETIRAMAIEIQQSATYLYVGGDFTAVNGVLQRDVAQVPLGTGQLPPVPWYPELADDGPGHEVTAILLDGGFVYIGGNFSGTATVTRPGLVAISTGLPTLSAWDPQLPSGSSVTGIAATTSEIVFVGSFSSAGGATRSGAACLTKIAAIPTSFQPVANGAFTTVDATSGGLIYLGGDFTSIAQDLSIAAPTFTRKGIAAIDSTGNVMPWIADAVTPGTSEIVNKVRRDGDRLWVAGRFENTSDPSQHDITWFSTQWYITTPSLPDVGSSQTYPATTMQLSDVVPGVQWTIQPSTSWLSIDINTGELSGTAPPVHHGGPATNHPFTIFASDAGTVTSRSYVVRINPAPPPIVVKITGPSQIYELDTLARTVNWNVEVELPSGTQALSTPIHVTVAYTNGIAREGYEYARQVEQIYFYPTGQVPTSLPAKTIATASLSIDLPVTIYGDKIYDPVLIRDFTIRIATHTTGVEAHPVLDEVLIDIEDDDQVPKPELAFVAQAGVFEDPYTPANAQGVLNAFPYIVWQFGSETPNEVQGAWQVQLSTDPQFGTIIFDESDSTAGNSVQTYWYLPADGLPPGDYYARVKV